MDGIAFGAFIGCVTVVCLNLSLFAYGYGKLTQKVTDTTKRLDRVERKLDKYGGNPDGMENSS